jgi:hypothetical protein
MTPWEREKLKDCATLAQSAIKLLSQLDRELIPQIEGNTPPLCECRASHCARSNRLEAAHPVTAVHARRLF